MSHLVPLSTSPPRSLIPPSTLLAKHDNNQVYYTMPVGACKTVLCYILVHTSSSITHSPRPLAHHLRHPFPSLNHHTTQGPAPPASDPVAISQPQENSQFTARSPLNQISSSRPSNYTHRNLGFYPPSPIQVPRPAPMDNQVLTLLDESRFLSLRQTWSRV